MRKTIAIFFVLLAAPICGFAKPIYLNCITNNDKPWFSVMLDESTGRVTHKTNDGSAFNADGAFSIDEISYKNVYCNSIGCLTSQFSINRTTLQVSSSVALDSKPGLESYKSTSAGKCTIVAAPARQI